MTNVCLLGNSHLAALIHGARETPDRWADLNFTWFAAPQNALAQFGIRDKALIPNGPDAKAAMEKFQNGADHYDLAPFDAFVIVGAELSLFNTLRLYSDARFYPLPSVKHAPDLATLNVTLISQSAFRAASEALIARTMGLSAARALRKATGKPVLFAAQPFLSEDVMADTGANAVLYKQMMHHGDGAHLAIEFRQSTRAVCKAAGVKPLEQPIQTVKDHALTLRSYSVGSCRLTDAGRIEHPTGDVLHANQAYGALVLDQVQEALAA